MRISELTVVIKASIVKRWLRWHFIIEAPKAEPKVVARTFSKKRAQEWSRRLKESDNE